MATKQEYLNTVEKIVNPPEAKDGGGTGAWCQEIRTNADVPGNQTSQALWASSDAGPYDAMSKASSETASMENRFLQKIAGFTAHIPKFGLGISAASLGVSLANFHNTSVSAKANADKVNLERRSLNALHNINRTLTPAQMNPSKLNNNTDRSKI